MKVTAMLSWYDEPPELLAEAVKSAGVIADRLVAADGAYLLVADKAESSPPQQRQAIEAAANYAGLELGFLTPRIWRGQVEKRNAVMAEAVKGSNWVVVLDADWLIEGNRESIRAELQSYWDSGMEQVQVAFFEPTNSGRDIEVSAAHEWHKSEAGTVRLFPAIYRAMDNLRYDANHWSVSASRPDGSEVRLFEPGETTARLSACCLITHRCLFRGLKQIERNRAFCIARDMAFADAGFEL